MSGKNSLEFIVYFHGRATLQGVLGHEPPSFGHQRAAVEERYEMGFPAHRLPLNADH